MNKRVARYLRDFLSFDEYPTAYSFLKTVLLNLAFLGIATKEYDYMVISNLNLYKTQIVINPTSIFSICCVTLVKDYVILFLVKLYGMSFYSIKGRSRSVPVAKFFGEFHLYVWIAAFTEGLTLSVLLKVLPFYAFGFTPWSYLTFFPIMFVFEIIFDFFHYWAHRLSHSGVMYRKIHKMHHKYRYPSPITTFYQHPLELLISNSIPSFLTLIIMMYGLNIPITYFQLVLIMCWKTVIEVAGHIGKYLAPASSFPQFVWLSKWLNFELYVEDHDLHHREFTCNYSKRFSLWDKIFGTYVDGKTFELKT